MVESRDIVTKRQVTEVGAPRTLAEPVGGVHARRHGAPSTATSPKAAAGAWFALFGGERSAIG
jgi:hypothetical protein